MVYILSFKYPGEQRAWHEVFSKRKQAIEAGKHLETNSSFTRFFPKNDQNEWSMNNNQYMIERAHSFYDGA